jgi:hypothetical protein
VKKLFFVMFVVMVAVGMAAAQTYTQGVGLTGDDILGAHQNGGRGCAGCHAPHSGAAGGGGNVNYTQTFTDTQSGSVALFGQDVSPLFGYTLTMGNGTVEVLPAQAAAYSTNTAELEGIMMCLACHDGVVAKGAMMNGQSFEQRMGLLPSGVYGTRPIPTLLGNDSGNGNSSGYLNDHPVGLNATLLQVGVVTNVPATSPLAITVAGGKITAVKPQGTYINFVAQYGYPAIAGSVWDYGVGVTAGDNGTGNTAFITCTTCHNQHQMYVYQGPGTYPGSTTAKMTGSNIGVGTYPTYFFVNSPYNPGAGNTNPKTAASTTQFCRQCHFDTANENFGIAGVTTQY